MITTEISAGLSSLLTQLGPQPKRRTRRTGCELPKDVSAWLYVWQCENCRWLKVGWATRPWQRSLAHVRTHKAGAAYGMQSCACDRWRLLALVAHGTFSAEAVLHKDLGALVGSRQGEWFEATLPRLQAVLALRMDPRVSLIQPIPVWYWSDR